MTSPATPYDSALIGNCTTAMLVARDGTVSWGCLPTFSSDAVFAHVLDPGRGGRLAVSVVGSEPVSQRYVPRTNVVTTRWEGDGGTVEVVDWMPRYAEGENFVRASTLYRLIRVIEGEPTITVVCDPRPGFGAEDPDVVRLADSVEYESEVGTFFLATSLPVDAVLAREEIRLTGDAYLAFSAEAPPAARTLDRVETDLERTVAYWRRWSDHCHLPLDYQQPILRSALILKLLTYETTGAVLAAPTTSLPEVRGGPRNWDYRYCWLRDSFFTVQALARLAQFEEEAHFLSYVHELPLRPGRLQPVYGLNGETDLTERTLDHLAGAFGSRPVRVGNQAFEHVQNDVYGELMLALTPLFFDLRFADRPHRDLLWRVVRELAEDVMSVWREPDAGIWEYRGEMRHHVFSKLMCWAALDRAALIANTMGERDLAQRWARESRRVRADVHEHGWSDARQAYTAAYSDESLDAANLLLAHTGFLSPEDPRYVATVRAVEEHLVVDGLCFRYRAVDDFGTPESTFSICTLWYIDALRLIGERKRATQLFEAFLARGNHVGLYAEGIHASTGAPTGNFPQAYTHVALINSGMMLSRPWGDIGARNYHLDEAEQGDP